MKGSIGPRYYGYKRVTNIRKFKAVRAKARFTQEKLAEAADVDRKVVQRAEQGLNITKENAVAIAAALNCPLDELFIDAVSVESQSTELITQDAKPRPQLVRSPVVTDSRTSGHQADIQHVYCADMTQLIAGDAYLLGLTTGRTERMAESAFEYLTTILCNDTPIYFAKPKTLNLKTPIIRAWHEASLESLGKKNLPKRQLPAPASDRHEVMSDAFMKWVKDARYREAIGYTNAELLADWTRYHLSDKDLLEMYWSNNTPDEMMNALDAFRTVRGLEKRSDVALDAVLATNSVLPDKISRAHWGRRPSRDFYPAWAYWNFAKGYRYILQIPNPGAYVCHWLREDACTEGVEYETALGERNLLKGLFPWGLVIGEIAQRFKLHTSADAIYGAVMELRRYTKENIEHLSVFEDPAEAKLDMLRERTVEFMQGALALIAPSKWERLLQGTHLENIVLVPYIVGQLGLEMSFSEMRTGLDLVLAPDTDPAGEKRDAIITETLVRLSRYRKTARGFVARYEREFMSFWQERGWV